MNYRAERVHYYGGAQGQEYAPGKGLFRFFDFFSETCDLGHAYVADVDQSRRPHERGDLDVEETLERNGIQRRDPAADKTGQKQEQGHHQVDLQAAALPRRRSSSPRRGPPPAPGPRATGAGPGKKRAM